MFSLTNFLFRVWNSIWAPDEPLKPRRVLLTFDILIFQWKEGDTRRLKQEPLHLLRRLKTHLKNWKRAANHVVCWNNPATVQHKQHKLQQEAGVGFSRLWSHIGDFILPVSTDFTSSLGFYANRSLISAAFIINNHFLLCCCFLLFTWALFMCSCLVFATKHLRKT